MAKTVTLTVKVDDTEFKQFVARFNAFSGQIKNLNTQFSQINTTIQKAAVTTNALTSSMKALWQTTKSLTTTVASITTHFIKWSALIGGIGALLGMGGGLFGIERLAASILQKRKQVLGLGGGDYGRTQAAQIFGGQFLDNPGNVLQNIAAGQKGSPDQLRALLGLGAGFGNKQSAAELLPTILQNLQQKLKEAPQGTELAVGHAFGAGALGLTDADVIRLRTMTAQQLKDFEKQIIERGKEMTLSEKAQKGWADLETQFRAAKAAIETTFGEKLADLAKPLGDLSESLVKLVKTLLDMPIVEKMIKQLTKWIEQLNTYLQSNDLEADLKKFSDKVESWLPILTDLKDALLGFATVIRSIYRFLYPTEMQPRAPHPPTDVQPPFGGTWPTNPNPLSTPNRIVPDSRILNVPGAIPGTGGANPPGATPGSSGGANPFPPVPSWGGGRQGSIGGTQFAGSQFFGGGSRGNSLASFSPSSGGNRFASFSPSSGRNSLASFSSSRGDNMGGNFAQLTKGGSSTLVGGDSNNSRSSWSSAASKATPGSESRSTFAGIYGFGGGGGGAGGGGGRGPLDSNNWQSSRTASLVIRNPPGTNLNMAATGMAG